MGRVATITASNRNIERPEEASDLRLPRGRRPVTGLVKVRQAWPRSSGACESAALLPVTTPLRPQKRSQPAPPLPQLPSPILGPTLQQSNLQMISAPPPHVTPHPKNGRQSNWRSNSKTSTGSDTNTSFSIFTSRAGQVLHYFYFIFSKGDY